MFLVSARGKNSSMSVATSTATAALSKLGTFQSDGFSAIVLDERGREFSLDQLRAQAANEARPSAAPTPGGA